MDSTVENAEPVLDLHFSACRKGFPGDKEAGDRSRSTHNCVAAHGRESRFVRLNVAGFHRMAHFWSLCMPDLGSSRPGDRS
jgi:hypothetical protein